MARLRDRLGGMIKDLEQPSQCSLSAGKYGRDPAVSLWPRKGELERWQSAGVHRSNLLLAAFASAMPRAAARQRALQSRAVPELGIRPARIARDHAGMYLSNQVTSRVR
jgi:hypothetical protein